MFDSNLQLYKQMPCTYPHRAGDKCAVPKSLVKSFRIEALENDGSWRTVFSESANYQRLVRVPLQVRTQALRFVAGETWGDPETRVFGFEALDVFADKIPSYPDGPSFVDLRSQASPEDLAPPDTVVAPDKPKGGISA